MTSPHPNLVRFLLAGSALDSVATRDAASARLLLTIAWWCRWVPGGPSRFVSSPVPEARALELRAALAGVDGLTEIDVTDEYAFGATTAPEACDVCGTLTAGPPGAAQRAASWRLVAIRAERVDLQAASYAAGRHAFELVSSPAASGPRTPHEDPDSGRAPWR